MSSNTIPIDLNYEKLRLLLRRLSNGLLDIDQAQELRQLLESEKINANRNYDHVHEKQISELIQLLDSFIAGEIDLRTNPVSTTKTHRYSIQ
jgi:hypothetical protein